MNPLDSERAPIVDIGGGRSVSPAHQAAIGCVLSELRAEFGDALLGVVLCGSVARGDATSDSDVDLVVLTDEKWSEMRCIRRAGVEIDLFIHWSTHAQTQVPLGGLYPVMRMLADGVVLVDTAGTAQQLTQVARRLIDLPRPVRPATVVAARLTVVGYLRTMKGYAAVRDSAENAAECALVMGRLINYCIELYNAENLRWNPPHKHRLPDIGRTEPALYRAMVCALDGSLPIADRVRAGEAVARAVLGDGVETEDIAGPRTVHDV